MMRIHLVGNEPMSRQLISKWMENDAHQVTCFSHPILPSTSDASTPDLWVIDLSNPQNHNEFSSIQILRSNSKAPILLMTSAESAQESVLHFDDSFDEIIVKPFSRHELSIRLIRATRPITQLKKVGPYQIDVLSRTVFVREGPVILSAKEFDLLQFLVEHRGVAIPREQFARAIWHETFYGSVRLVDDLMRRLRKRLPELEVTALYGFGYRLE
ncbi:MAG: response regulator transcription factor [Candidatus Izemoplasmatales bacterium]|nr:response regulator transcription factor [Candidatus Izemoplasmatales bacterium]